MAELDFMKNATAAVLFLQAGMTTLDAYSTFQSSPWTAENFGADERKAASCREYLAHAAIYSTAYCTLAAYLAGSWWPIIGSIINNAYLLWLYNRAIGRAVEAGSDGWEKS